ncbi:glucosaminidase domain-containing protein [Marinilabiliaceae bacterium ANBcel2]|nr:glucosaminidase domain-containing protein [Marinilabiliaceae bacterium ANBcel2]
MAGKSIFSLVITSFIYLFFFNNVYGGSRITTAEYIETYKAWAVNDMQRTGIPASIKLAQGILESGSGNSHLAKNAKNHFGIKCHRDWEGARTYHHDDARNECFRKYDNPLSSFEDHSEFLTGRDRYAGLFELATTDYKGWAHELSRAGYATNPSYARLLIKIIEDNELYKLDQDISETARRSRRATQRHDASGDLIIDPYERRPVSYNNGVKYIELLPGDNFKIIADMFDLREWELPEYNDLPRDADISKFRILYIERKRRNSHPDHPEHRMKEGETLFDVSQQYGVRLNRLYRYNDLQEGEEPDSGDIIKLR